MQFCKPMMPVDIGDGANIFLCEMPLLAAMRESSNTNIHTYTCTTVVLVGVQFGKCSETTRNYSTVLIADKY